MSVEPLSNFSSLLLMYGRPSVVMAIDSLTCFIGDFLMFSDFLFTGSGYDNDLISCTDGCDSIVIVSGICSSTLITSGIEACFFGSGLITSF